MKWNWNSMFGIDHDVAVSDKDQKYIHDRIADDGRNRSAAKIRPPKRMQIVYLPMMIIFITGLIAVAALGWPIWSMVFFFLAAVCCQVLAERWIARHHYGPIVRRELRARGYQICVSCGYWLRSLNSDVRNCPECGAAIAGADQASK